MQGGSIYTPASNILKGVTRKQLLSRHGEIKEQDIEADRLFDFDEIFITSTSRDITPVVAIDGKQIGDGKPGKVTRELL